MLTKVGNISLGIVQSVLVQPPVGFGRQPRSGLNSGKLQHAPAHHIWYRQSFGDPTLLITSVISPTRGDGRHPSSDWSGPAAATAAKEAERDSGQLDIQRACELPGARCDAQSTTESSELIEGHRRLAFSGSPFLASD